MKFEVEKPILLKALSNINGAVEKKNTLPILQNVMIETRGRNITLTATDMDIMVFSTFESNPKSDSITTVSAQMFYDIVRKIPDDSKIEINQEENILQIKSGKSRYKLPTIDASEFPSFAEGEIEEEIEIDTEKFIEIIDKTRFAISNDDMRYYLNGIYLHTIKSDSGCEVRSVSTDGHMLAMSSAKIDSVKSGFAIIIPKKSVFEIRKIIDGTKTTKISVSRTKIKVQTSNAVIMSKLIDAEYPDYSRILPKGNDNVIIINKKKFFDCVDRISIMASDKHKSLKMTVEDNKIALQVSDNNGSFAYEELDVLYSSEKIETGFNSRYLLDVISQIDKEVFSMKLKDGNCPALIESEGSSSMFVIMPIRV
jgi:DNA polymerase-3 subunit beta